MTTKFFVLGTDRTEHTQDKNNYRHIATLMSRNLLLLSANIARDLGR